MTQDHEPDLPPNAGHRARQDPSGEVHGSGAGAGGGQQGEDIDPDEHGGGGKADTPPGPGERGTAAQ
jgi:hypothetical protein